MKNNLKKVNKVEQRHHLKELAMPEVKILVKRFGRSIVSSCLMTLADYDKKVIEFETAKMEVEKLEQELK